MKIIFLMLPVVYLAGNGYLFLRVWQAMNSMPVLCKVVVTVLFWIVAFSLFVGIGLRDAKIPDVMLKCMLRVGAVWMGFLLYMVLLLAVFDVAGSAIIETDNFTEESAQDMLSSCTVVDFYYEYGLAD